MLLRQSRATQPLGTGQVTALLCLTFPRCKLEITSRTLSQRGSRRGRSSVCRDGPPGWCGQGRQGGTAGRAASLLPPRQSCQAAPGIAAGSGQQGCPASVPVALDFQIERDPERHLTSFSIKYLFVSAGHGLSMLGQALCRGNPCPA